MRCPERVRKRGPDTHADTLSNMSASMSADTQSDTDDGTRRACPAPPLWPRRGQGAEDTFGCVVAPKPTHPDMFADTLADMSGGHATGHAGGHARTRSDTLARALLLAIAPTVAEQVGEGIREWLRARRERDAPCEHGRPGGRLCPHCWMGEGRDG